MVPLCCVPGDSWNQAHSVPRSLLYTLPVGIGLFALQPLINGALCLLFPFLGAPKLLHLFPAKMSEPVTLSIG